MNDRLVQTVKTFMKLQKRGDRPFLLGYSGGPDSKALLYLLIECQRSLSIKFSVVHFDHGWREKSGEEAKEIAEEIKRLGLQLFTRRSKGCGIPERNGEALARQERIEFFEQIYREIDAQGLLLAHQADDQGETVLKRLLEGAHPLHWTGMTAESELRGMRILRPLLSVEKRRLENWIKERGCSALLDPTNRDPRFLRGRMRTDILPYLSDQFGKEISGNLCKAALASQEILTYLVKKCHPHWKTLIIREGEVSWDLSHVTELLELKWLLKIWSEREQIQLSYEMIQAMGEGIVSKKRLQFSTKAGVIYLNSGVLKYINRS
jgi:tRNA(Ile)-lysidine synthase